MKILEVTIYTSGVESPMVDRYLLHKDGCKTIELIDNQLVAITQDTGERKLYAGFSFICTQVKE